MHKIDRRCTHCGIEQSLIHMGKGPKDTDYALTTEWPQRRWVKVEDNWYCHLCENKHE